ncbi:MAG: hypothetical protein A3K30_03875 [Deltaproteobacteria bacterium RBG_13_51_10]|nr:MAG: hypothetical protein A3K30_03875 [Deltaproteobacteria bacterium RBG_13_51_10]
MIRVYQDKFGEEGNCFEACLASILEIKLERIPTIMKGNWLRTANVWLKENFNLGLLGVFLPSLSNPPLPMDGALQSLFDVGVFYIVTGKGPRGLDHACVADSGKIVHDPHPSGEGLKKEEESYFLVKL